MWFASCSAWALIRSKGKCSKGPGAKPCLDEAWRGAPRTRLDVLRCPTVFTGLLDVDVDGGRTCALAATFDDVVLTD